ncbi:MAG: hypothetical protein ABDH18_05240 [Aquificaceae bacterium]
MPKKILLRILWKVFRWSFEKLGYQRGINWLRSWKVSWVVVINGREMAVFKERAKAIEWEKKHFIRGGLP